LILKIKLALAKYYFLQIKIDFLKAKKKQKLRTFRLSTTHRASAESREGHQNRRQTSDLHRQEIRQKAIAQNWDPVHCKPSIKKVNF
jgi:hypothetical protein